MNPVGALRAADVLVGAPLAMAVRAIEPPLPLAPGFPLAPLGLAPLGRVPLRALPAVLAGQHGFGGARRLAPLLGVPLLEIALPGRLMRLAFGEPPRHGPGLDPP